MILVDDRTGAVELAELLGAPHVVCHLDYADFCWSGCGPTGPVNVGVERKSILDFLQSMTTGRLSGHQLVGLTQQYDWVYIILEGVWRADREHGMLMRMNHKGKWVAASQGSRRFMARDVWNFISSMGVMCGVTTVATSSKWESAKWLDSIHGWWSKPWTSHKSHLQFHKPVAHAQLSKPGLTTRFFSQLEGIGWDKARKLGAAFPTMKDVLEAEDWAVVDGIGPKLAKSIAKQIWGGEDESDEV